MAVYIVLASVLLPLLACAVCFISPNEKLRKLLGSVFGFTLLLFGVFLFILLFAIKNISGIKLDINIEHVSLIVRFINAGLMIAVMVRVLSIRPRKIVTAVLCAIQIVVLFYMEAFVFTNLGGTKIYLDTLTLVALMCVMFLGSAAVFACLTGPKGLKENAYIALVFLVILLVNCAIVSNNADWFYFFWQITFFVTYMIINKSIAYEPGRKTDFLLNINIISGIVMAVGLILIYRSGATTILTDIAVKSNIGDSSSLYYSYGFGFIFLSVILRLGLIPFARFYKGLTGTGPEQKFPFYLIFYAAAFPGVFLILRLAPVLEGTFMGNVISAFAAFVFAVSAFILMFRNNRPRMLFYSGVSSTAAVFALAAMGNSALYSLGIVLLILNVLYLVALKAAMIATESNDASMMKVAAFIRFIAIPALSLGAILIKLFAIEISADKYLTSIALVIGCVFETVGMARRISEAVFAHRTVVEPKEFLKKPGKMRATLYISTLCFAVASIALPVLLSKTILPYVNDFVFQTKASILTAVSGIFVLNSDSVVIGGGKTTILYAIFIVVSIALYLIVYRSKKPIVKSEPFLCGVNYISGAGIPGGDPKFIGSADGVLEASAEQPDEARIPNYVDFAAVIYILAIFGVLIK